MFFWLSFGLLAAAVFCAVPLVAGSRRWGGVLKSVPTTRPELALTFDDGPDPVTTPEVLRVLEEHGVKATFFVIGEKVRRHPEVILAIAGAGHELGLHGNDHSWRSALRSTAKLRAELSLARDAITSLGLAAPRWFRAPIGIVSPAMLRAAGALDVRLVGWSASGRDGLSWVTLERWFGRLEKHLEPGAILALHDASERGVRVPVSVLGLPLLLEALHRRGLSPVALSELIRD